MDEEQRNGDDDDGAAEQGGEREPLAEDQRAKRDGHHRVSVTGPGSPFDVADASRGS